MSETKKSNVDFRWYVSPDLTWRRGAIIAAVWTLAVIVFAYSPLGRDLETRVARPAEFELRSLLGRDPQLDPRIKIYGFDDATASYVNEFELDFVEWAQIIKSFGEAKPRSVIVDRLFGVPRGKDVEKAAEELKKLPFPIVAGAFASPKPVKNRPSLTLDQEFYKLPESMHWLPLESRIAYGPSPAIRDAFTVGHILYDGNFQVRSLFRLPEDRGLPHAALLGAGKPTYVDGEMIVDGKPVITDRAGKILVNLPSPENISKRVYQLASVLKRARAGHPVTTLPSDAAVVILPGHFTGGTDMAQTPFGTVPGGYIVIAILNSALTGNWLAYAPFTWLWVFLTGGLGLFFGMRLHSMRFWGTVFGSLVGVTTLGLLLFVYSSLVSPWLFCLFSLFGTALGTFAERARSADVKANSLRNFLEGAVSPSQLNAILSKPSTLALEPTAQTVTVMFIDVVGFSLVAERQTAREAFFHLKALLADLTEIVHEFGGVVDKTLGDGMLCFFGYNYDGSPPDAEHARKAIMCGIKIQRRAIERNLSAAAVKEPLYPVRIGINTAQVFIGDLGNTRRIDLTLIGHGVNFAKRLESACDTHCLMLGTETYKAMMGQGLEYFPLRLRYIQIKHHSELLEAYECDPVAHEPEMRRNANEAYRLFTGINRKDTRVLVGNPVGVSSPMGKGHIIDYSESGLSLNFDTYLGVGVSVNLSIDGLAEEMMPLLAEVRWGQVLNGGRYQLGVSLKNLSPEQKKRLFDTVTGLAAGTRQAA